MSFRCEFCKLPQLAGVAPVKVVTKRRERSNQDRGGSGWEIAQEKSACPPCAQDLEKQSLRQEAKTANFGTL